MVPPPALSLAVSLKINQNRSPGNMKKKENKNERKKKSGHLLMDLGMESNNGLQIWQQH